MTAALKNVSGKLTDILSATVEDLSSLEVRTCTADDIEDRIWDHKARKYTGPSRLRAQTNRVKFVKTLADVVGALLKFR